MNKEKYAYKFVQLINEHDEQEMIPLLAGMYLAVVGTSLELGMSDGMIRAHMERAIDYFEAQNMDTTRH